MKKLVRQIFVLMLLGGWAVTALALEQGRSQKCTEERKKFSNNNNSNAATTNTKINTGSNVELQHPGFWNLIFYTF